MGIHQTWNVNAQNPDHVLKIHVKSQRSMSQRTCVGFPHSFCCHSHDSAHFLCLVLKPCMKMFPEIISFNSQWWILSSPAIHPLGPQEFYAYKLGISGVGALMRPRCELFSVLPPTENVKAAITITFRTWRFEVTQRLT